MSPDSIELIRELLDDKLRVDRKILMMCIENDEEERLDEHLCDYRTTLQAITDFENLIKGETE